MSDVMLLGVLRMPIPADPDPLTLHQLIDRARQAADRIESDAAELERKSAALQRLWRERDELRAAALRLLAAIDKLDEGPREPGFAGWQNGKGEPCGDEVEAARHELARLVRANTMELDL